MSDWYQSLVDDCKAAITEAVFNSRWELIAGYHAVGKRIAHEKKLSRSETYGKKIMNDLSQSIGISQRRLWSAVQFYKAYPDLNQLPDGKNISWNKIVTKLLPTPPAGIVEPNESISCFCPTCGHEHRKANQ
mgnify:FL=1